MFDMIVQIVGVNEDIIYVDDDKLVQVVSEDLIHKVLEYGGCID